ncbi:hypothetical protein EFL26_12400 [Nocardioides pocheonensis]|uniref:Uncharacterized protein n=1 Tax=Nocardioides pocheonensis TaxID=661485 RepID=A0A3N0GMT4_9ACTN|nr:hypothetical protein EFL26_12400 [Nocardioides pocheonensis]
MPGEVLVGLVVAVAVTVVDPVPDPWWCLRSGRGAGEVVADADAVVSGVPALLEADFFFRAVGAETEAWSADADADADAEAEAASRAAYSTAAAESAPTRDAPVDWAPGTERS